LSEDELVREGRAFYDELADGADRHETAMVLGINDPKLADEWGSDSIEVIWLGDLDDRYAKRTDIRGAI
jgi:hypothetical protein